MTAVSIPSLRVRRSALVVVAAVATVLVALTVDADTNQDWDGDGVLNQGDNCPYQANASQADEGGLLSTVRDGVGSACQCGDVGEDGAIDLLDLVVYARELVASDPLGVGEIDLAKCDVAAPLGSCDSGDLAALRQAVAEQPGVALGVCAAAVGAISTPQNLAAFAGNGRVLLDWDSLATGVAQYRVYRAALSGGPYTEITASPVSQSSYEDSGVSNAPTYYYVVRAVGQTLSDPSNEASTMPAIGSGGTVVPALIDSSTTWTLLGSPYQINGVVKVNGGATLTIEPGVHVRFASAGELRIALDGPARIEALGSEQSPIVFERSGTTYNWRQLTLEAGTDATSVIDNLTLDHPGNGPVSAIVLRSVPSTVQLSNIRITSPSWRGVFISGGGPNLHGWDIEAAPGQIGINVDTASDSRFSGVRATGGLRMPNDASNAAFFKVEFTDYSAGPPLDLHASLVGELMPNVRILGWDAASKIDVKGTTISRPGTWTAHRYDLAAGLAVDGPDKPVWTIEAGAEIRVPTGNNHIDIKSGSLRALGTLGSPVLFTSRDPLAPGLWTKMQLWPQSDPSELRHLTIEGAGAFSVNTSLVIEATPSVMDGVIVRERGAAGILFDDVDAELTGGTVESISPPAAFPAIEVLGTVGPRLSGWTIAGNTAARAIEVSAAENFELHDSTVSGGLDVGVDLGPKAITGNTFTDYDAGQGLRLPAEMVGDVTALNSFPDWTPGQSDVAVVSGNIVRDATWPALDYRLAGTVSVDDPAKPIWTISQGAELAMALGTGSRSIEVISGSLRALGTSTNPVVFTSQASTVAPAQWTQLRLHPTSEPSELLYLSVRGAGAGSSAAVQLERSPIALEGLAVSERGNVGLHLAGASGTFTGGTIAAGTTGVGVLVTGTGRTTLDGWTISGDSTVGSPEYGVDVSAAQHFEIRSGSVVNDGIRLGTTAPLILRDSIVTNSVQQGVYCPSTTAVPVIDRNTFTGNAVGIQCAAGARITRNTITGGSTGILISDAHPQLRIRNNNLTGNAVAVSNTDAVSGVDARLNWWGSAAKPVTGISGQVAVNPWLGSAFAGPFAIEEAAILPEALSPGSDTTLAGQFSALADWSLEIRDPGSAVVHSESGTDTLTYIDWNGVVGGTNPAAGTYAFTLAASPDAGGTAAPSAIGEFVLGATQLTARIDSPLHLAHVVPGLVTIAGSVTGAASPSYTLRYARGAAPQPGEFQTIATGTAGPAGAFTNGWTISSPDLYTVRLEATGSDGQTSRDEVQIRVVATASLALGETHFSPNGDGIKDVLPVTGSVSVDVPWVVELRDGGSTIVREIAGAGRAVYAEWNGRNDANQLVPNGAYSATLRVDSVGVATAVGSTVLDTVPPVSVIAAPADGTPILGYSAVSVTGTASDANFDQYRLDYYAEAGSSPLGGATTPVSGGLLGTLPADSSSSPRFSNDDPITLRLRTSDLAGNVSVTENVLDSDRLEIRDVKVTSRSFDPDAGQTYELRFRASHAMDSLTFTMHPSGSTAVAATVVPGEPRSAGYHAVPWDGASGGTPVAAGVYFPSLTAQAGARSVVVNDPAAPESDAPFPTGTLTTANGMTFNVATYEALDFDPFRNDLIRLQFVNVSRPRRLNFYVDLLGDPNTPSDDERLQLVDEAVAPGQNVFTWDGRDAAGDIYVGPYTFWVADDAPAEWLSVGLLRSPSAEATAFRAHPYVFFPTKGGVTQLSYSLDRSASVEVRLSSPNGTTPPITLIDQLQSPGPQTVEWDARDPSGVIHVDEGSWDVTIEVTDALTGQTTVTRGTVMLLQ